MKHNDPKSMECSKSNTKREIYSNTNLSQKKKKKKLQMNNLTLHINELEKTNQTKSKVSRRKEIIKIRARIKEIKTLKNK